MEEREDIVLEIYEAVYSDAAHRERMIHMVNQMKQATRRGGRSGRD